MNETVKHSLDSFQLKGPRKNLGTAEAFIKTYEKDVKIYKDIENSQGTLLLQKCRPLYIYIYIHIHKCITNVYSCLEI